MTFTIKITIFIIIWFMVASVIIRKRWKEKEVNSGLTVLYVINLFLMHCFAALLYLLPWHRFVEGKYMLDGFQEATYGMCAFGLGNLILSPSILSLLSMPRNRDVVNKTEHKSQPKVIKMYFLIGLICYFILPPILGGLPTVTALMSAGQQLMITGLCLLCWQAWQENNKKRLRRWLIISFSLPFFSIILRGFLGEGVMMTLIILIFTSKFFRSKWRLIVIGVVLFYFGLSFYLMYMRDRDTLRSVIWSDSPMIARIKVLQDTLSKPILLNPFNVEHLESIDERMNQNILAGVAVEYLNSGKVDYAHGQTLWESLLAVIPRVVWQEKNIYAGSPGIVTKYTGVPFSEMTSVGVGQVMEFYINFGRMGVIIGFLCLGIIVAIIDTMAGYYLAGNNLQKFTLWFLPGLASFMCGSFVESTASAGASIFIAYLTGSAYLSLLFFILTLYVLMELIKRFILR